MKPGSSTCFGFSYSFLDLVRVRDDPGMEGSESEGEEVLVDEAEYAFRVVSGLVHSEKAWSAEASSRLTGESDNSSLSETSSEIINGASLINGLVLFESAGLRGKGGELEAVCE